MNWLTDNKIPIDDAAEAAARLAQLASLASASTASRSWCERCSRRLLQSASSLPVVPSQTEKSTCAKASVLIPSDSSNSITEPRSNSYS